MPRRRLLAPAGKEEFLFVRTQCGGMLPDGQEGVKRQIRPFRVEGERQNFALCRKAERIIAFGVLIEAVFPELVQAPAAVDATQR